METTTAVSVASSERGAEEDALQHVWGLIEAETQSYFEECVDAGVISTAEVKWYKNNGHGRFALIIEMMNEEKLQKEGKLQSYKNTIGRSGGWILD